MGTRARTLMKEIGALTTKPPHGIRLRSEEESDFDRLVAIIAGPGGSPYESQSSPRRSERVCSSFRSILSPFRSILMICVLSPEGFFSIRFAFPPDYPISPPKCKRFPIEIRGIRR